jgi:putative tryptophan/tyrosine transport system substrate-binding protein
MQRRAFVGLLGGALFSLLAARAQQPGVPVIAFLSSRSPDEAAPHASAFLQGLKQFGYVDGQNARIEYRWAMGQYDRLPALAKELVELRPAVMVAVGGTPSGRAARSATSSIPVLFVIGDDPVKAGLVASLNRPGGNATGVSLMTGALGGKRLELLAQLVPKAQVMALLVNPLGEDADPQAQDVQVAADALGRRLVIVRASTETELQKSFAALVESGASALVVENDPFFDSRREQIMALAADRRIPAIYHIREFPAAGGLMSYGPSLLGGYLQVGIQAGRILKGANAVDLPVVRPTQFELVLNLKTAKALGLTVPPTLLAQADEVIE